MDPASLKFFLDKCPWRQLPDKDGNPGDEILTGPVRLAFINLAKPRDKQYPDGTTVQEWSAVLIVPPAADLTLAKQLVAKLAERRFGPKWQDMARDGELKMPFKPQAKAFRKGYDGFAEEGVYLDCGSRYAVPVVAGKADATGKRPALDVANGSLVYSGMWALARIAPYAFPKPGTKGGAAGNQGVKFGLRALQKLADDEEFKGGSAADAFGDIDYSGAAASAPRVTAPAAKADGFADIFG